MIKEEFFKKVFEHWNIKSTSGYIERLDGVLSKMSHGEINQLWIDLLDACKVRPTVPKIMEVINATKKFNDTDRDFKGYKHKAEMLCAEAKQKAEEYTKRFMYNSPIAQEAKKDKWDDKLIDYVFSSALSQAEMMFLEQCGCNYSLTMPEIKNDLKRALETQEIDVSISTSRINFYRKYKDRINFYIYNENQVYENPDLSCDFETSTIPF